MSESASAVAAYLADLPDSRWSDLQGLAEAALSKWFDVAPADLELGISISLVLAQADRAEHRSPAQERIAQARAEEGTLRAAEMIASFWSTHNAGKWRNS